ncbi:MAG: hypothetical protein JEZ06_18805 [Anaerolineaceae bacterium]|nr:hypothetical protein [Anaerolineaceae bacterium]
MNLLLSQTTLLLLFTSIGILIMHRFRLVIIFLAIQYLIMFLLILDMWTIGLSSVKLVTGWMVCAILAASQVQDQQYQDNFTTASSWLFKLMASLMIFFSVSVISPELVNWLPLQQIHLSGGLLLIGMGILHLGLSAIPSRVIIGLLTIFSGFEIIYAGVENSVLVTGLLVVVNMGLALVGAYIFSLERNEEPS